MTYQGERARSLPSELGKSFEVSKVRIGPDGHVSDVLWGEVGRTDRNVSDRVLASATDVVDAIHDGARVAAVFPPGKNLPERNFVIVEHEDGRECITFAGPPSPGRDLADLALLDKPE